MTHDGGNHWSTLPLAMDTGSIVDVMALPEQTVAVAVSAEGEEALNIATLRPQGSSGRRVRRCDSAAHMGEEQRLRLAVPKERFGWSMGNDLHGYRFPPEAWLKSRQADCSTKAASPCIPPVHSPLGPRISVNRVDHTPQIARRSLH